MNSTIVLSLKDDLKDTGTYLNILKGIRIHKAEHAYLKRRSEAIPVSVVVVWDR